MAIREEMTTFFADNPSIAEKFKTLDANKQKDFIEKIFGNASEEVANPDFVPGYNRVKQEQRERPGVYSPISAAAKKIKEGEVPGLIGKFGASGWNVGSDIMKGKIPGILNIKPDSYWKEKGIHPSKGIRISDETKENLAIGASLMSIPYRAVESPIALAAMEAQAGNFSGMGGAFMKGIIDKETGEYGDLIRALSKKKTALNEFVASSIGTLASIGIGNKMYKGIGVKGKIADKTAYLKKTVEEAGHITKGVGDKIYSVLDDFHTANNTKLTLKPNNWDALIDDLSPKVKGTLKMPKDTKGAWEAKKTLGKQMKPIWRKLYNKIDLTPQEQVIKDVYYGIDDVIESGIENPKARIIYKTMNREASQAITDKSIVDAMLRDKSNRYADLDAFESAFKSGKLNAKQYLERVSNIENSLANVDSTYLNGVGKLERSMRQIMQDTKKYYGWRRAAKYVAGTAGYAGHAILTSKLLGKNIANKTD